MLVYKNAWWLYGCMMIYVDDRGIRNVWWLYGCMMTYINHRDIRMHDDLNGYLWHKNGWWFFL